MFAGSRMGRLAAAYTVQTMREDVPRITVQVAVENEVIGVVAQPADGGRGEQTVRRKRAIPFGQIEIAGGGSGAVSGALQAAGFDLGLIGQATPAGRGTARTGAVRSGPPTFPIRWTLDSGLLKASG